MPAVGSIFGIIGDTPLHVVISVAQDITGIDFLNDKVSHVESMNMNGSGFKPYVANFDVKHKCGAPQLKKIPSTNLLIDLVSGAVKGQLHFYLLKIDGLAATLDYLTCQIPKTKG